MPQTESVVVYDGLPISSGGAHSVNRLSAVEALRAWRAFLDSCTQQLECRAMFVVGGGAGPKTDRSVVRLIKATFPGHEPLSNIYPVGADSLDAAVQLLESVSPQPADSWGNTGFILGIDSDFRLLSPDGRGLWPGQEPSQFGDFETPSGGRLGVSSIRLSLNNHRAIGLDLTLPLATDADVRQMRPWLQDHLPFRLSNKHWVRWTLNRNGTTYRPKRIALD